MNLIDYELRFLHWLGDQIAEYGAELYLAFFVFSIVVISWILARSGRRSKGRSEVIVIPYWVPGQRGGYPPSSPEIPPTISTTVSDELSVTRRHADESSEDQAFPL